MFVAVVALAFGAVTPLTERTATAYAVENQAEEIVHVGGEIVGFTLKIDGVIVNGFTEVDTSAGKATLRSELREGDRIFSVDGERCGDSRELSALLNAGGDVVSLGIERAGEVTEISVAPLIERVSGKKRLGIEAREEVSGLGTLTFTRKNGEFVALGHCVCTADGRKATISGGSVYRGRIMGVERGIKGKAGSLQGNIVVRKRLGSVTRNEKNGIFGVLDEPCGEACPLASREEIVNGKASIRSAVGGKNELYDVEIFKNGYGGEAGERGLIVKVVDERLLSLTGGIVQGMSGSPIIQNGKLVGAVTHVLVSDPTRGYGIFADALEP